MKFKTFTLIYVHNKILYFILDFIKQILQKTCNLKVYPCDADWKRNTTTTNIFYERIS